MLLGTRCGALHVSKGLVKAGFDTQQVLQCCTVKDHMSAGVSKGHALQLMNSWDSGSSSGSSSDSSDIRIPISSDSDVPAQLHVIRVFLKALLLRTSTARQCVAPVNNDVVEQRPAATPQKVIDVDDDE